ncbi:MAG: class I SAM-dependent methyltransferase [Ignavibacteriales bacterium]|nr:class I SAM-dependent methyltransferase [Ignavibacteriales bacterium]
MKNTWLEIDLSDYENHMALPNIAQAQYLSNFLSNIVKTYQPSSLALLGCAGGNGLEKLIGKSINKIICVDINPNYISTAKNRFENKFNDIYFICSDITSTDFKIEKVDIIFAGLIFEYVDLNIAIRNISNFLNRNGRLAVILQQQSENIPEVSPSEYKSLEKLSEIFKFVSNEELIEFCIIYGLELISINTVQLDSGKIFSELLFQKT